MNEREVKLIIGALLHDIGKIVFRSGKDNRKHSISGYEYLKNTIGISDREILDCVRFHHADSLKNADISDDSLAYIVYIADNIASASDRRESDQKEGGFDTQTPLQPVFNLLNRNNANKFYSPFFLNETEGINYPTNEKKDFSRMDYSRIIEDITDHLHGMNWDNEYVNSLLEIMEADLSFVPSSTSKREVPDISLFDHLKMTAAFAGCICLYLKEKGVVDFKKILFENAERFYKEDVFLLASLDISGIQKFIYTITTKDALKTLRSRSFYLEILMEYVIDSLLDRIGLCRANRIYSGGGHCYLLLPNTEAARVAFDQYIDQLNGWLLKEFDHALFIAGGYAPCSGVSLKNEPDGSYSNIFHQISVSISEKKLHRYSAKEIIQLNHKKVDDYTRECSVCKRMGKISDDGICESCKGIVQLSGKILYADFFAVTTEEKDGLHMPEGGYLSAGNKESIVNLQKRDHGLLRIYAKNNRYTGQHLATKLWVGNYSSGSTFEEFAQKAIGINRIGVLRADVDNLGMAFVAGFDNSSNHNRYVTLSRTATLSRQLSLFFKYFINQVLEKPDYRIQGNTLDSSRNAAIVYSGGDDVFIVGAWNDILEIGIDLRRKFEHYTDGTLSMSAGIGVFSPGYPIHAIASEVGAMEERAKQYPGKNAVTLFDGKTYGWKEFEDEVIGEKYGCIFSFFSKSQERGKNFLYNLLELIRNQEEKINFARFVYLISRMEPRQGASDMGKKAYHEFSKNMMKWIHQEKDRRQLETAMTIYAYHTRETEGQE